jgi:hypothetical protein
MFDRVDDYLRFTILTSLSAALLVLSRYRDNTNYADVRVIPMLG